MFSRNNDVEVDVGLPCEKRALELGYSYLGRYALLHEGLNSKKPIPYRQQLVCIDSLYEIPYKHTYEVIEAKEKIHGYKITYMVSRKNEDVVLLVIVLEGRKPVFSEGSEVRKTISLSIMNNIIDSGVILTSSNKIILVDGVKRENEKDYAVYEKYLSKRDVLLLLEN